MDAPRRRAGESFARSLARQYMAQRGFESGVVPEASALADACDIALTRTDALTFEILCIVDRDAHPERSFGLDPEAVRQIGEACLKYTGRIQRTKMPVSIVILEIGAAANTADDRARLALFTRRSLFAKAHISAKIVDPETGAIWTNVPAYQLNKGTRFIAELLRGPRSDGAEMLRPMAFAQDRGAPVVAWSVLGVLAAAFALELLVGGVRITELLRPSLAALVALGGLNWTLVVDDGEWYRLLTAPLLHADGVHLLMNGVALLIAGAVVERLVGGAWFFVLFSIGAVAGSLLSLLLNPETVVSIGASGAIMALLAAGFVLSYRLRWGRERTQVQLGLLQMLIPSLLPLATSATGQHVDFAAHLGGALAGGAAGYALLKTWPAAAPVPQPRWLGPALASAGIAAFLCAAVLAAVNYGA